MRLPLRARLLLGFLIPVIVTGATAGVVGAWMIGDRVADQAQDKARLDLNSARLIYQQSQSELLELVRLSAASPALAELLAAGRPEDSLPRLEAIRRRERLDVLNLVDPAGTVLMRSANPGLRGDSRAGDPVVAQVIAGREAVAASAVYGPADLAREGGELAARARIELLPTRQAAPDDRGLETSGLFLEAAAAVTGADGRRLGILHGARLLNRDTEIVDRIRQTIYEDETYHGREVGEGTICLGDVRIATNARLAGGERAVGSRVDQAVRRRVLDEGQPRIERAFVVDDWHITAYEPIRDTAGRVVGILSLGISERKFTDIRKGALTVFFLITLVGITLSAAISGLVARRIMRPVRSLLAAVRGMTAGELGERVAPDPGIPELELLGGSFNELAEAVQTRDRRIQEFARREIGRSERLAMVGRLAAGVAHEINNPLGGILLFSHLLLRKASPDGIERQNLERISSEAKRCQKIVQGLLDFARHREPKTETADLARVFDQSLDLVAGQAMFQNVEVVRHVAPGLPPVRIDTAQFQQVFINILMNAVEAMEGRGRLTVTVEPADGGRQVQLALADTGRGIPPENMARLFEPFFTTKEVGHGTGLGLSISQGIVENHGGTILAESTVGQGTTFFIRLPAAAEAG